MYQQLGLRDYQLMRGLSTDRIGIPTYLLNVMNAVFLETDTGLTYIWDGKQWNQTPIPSSYMIGPTANRPTPTMIGQAYFDTTLGYGINCQQVSPPIWVNGAGGVV